MSRGTRRMAEKRTRMEWRRIEMRERKRSSSPVVRLVLFLFCPSFQTFFSSVPVPPAQCPFEYKKGSREEGFVRRQQSSFLRGSKWQVKAKHSRRSRRQQRR